MAQFFQNAATCAEQVVVMFLLMLLGLILYRKKKLTGDGVRQITTVLLWVVTPCLIVNALQTAGLGRDSLRELGQAILAAVLCYALSIAVSIPIFRKAREELRGVMRYATAFSNAGFMGVPLAQAVFGQKATAIATIFVIFFNLLSWTVGIAWYGQKLNLKKALINPGTVGLAIGVAVVLLPKLWHGTMPDLVLRPISLLAGLNTPLAMIVVGTYLDSFSFRFSKKDRWMILVTALRLVLLPLVTLGIFRLVGLDGWLAAVCMVPVCAPTAANTILFAVMFEKHAAFAARVVAFTTLLSVATMPLIVALAMAGI